MKTTGELYEHRGLITLTGAFLAAFALSACGNEKINDLQAMYENLPVHQTEIVLQKKESRTAKEPLTAGASSVALALRQAMNADNADITNADKIDFVQPVLFAKRIVPSESALSPEEPIVFPIGNPMALPIGVSTVALPSQTVSAPQPAQCWMGDVATPLREVVTALEKESLLYATGPLTDCSGIFHRVLLGLKHRCPAKDFPTVEKHRDSRALARWYHERGKLQLIKNAVESTDLLKPGAVLFFGKNGSVYKDFSIDDLLVPQKGIDHLGVVVKVHRDESGQVLDYELFHGHGRKGKTPASITNWHKRTPSRVGYPPLGNGRQQWVAIARL
ncbi:NlpC/P60 family protein [Candidatus Electrothrix aarhusensis]